MSLFDKIFPRKGADDSIKAEDEAKRENSVEKDYLSLESFDFKHHPIKSMREHMRLVRQGIYKGDKKAWHQFLMVTMIAFVGTCLFMTIVIDFCAELINIRMLINDEFTMRVIQRSKETLYVQESLPEGEYGLINIFQSSSFHKGEENGNDTVVVVASLKGGALLLAAVPNGTEVPSEWYGADSYKLVVDTEGKWAFQQSEFFSKRKEAMEKAQAEYMKRMEEMQQQAAQQAP